MRADQRYCLECGRRRGDARVDFEALLGLGDEAGGAAAGGGFAGEAAWLGTSAAPFDAGDARASSAGAPSRRRVSRPLAAGLSTVVLALGITAGALLRPGPAASLAAGAAPVILAEDTPAPVPDATPAAAADPPPIEESPTPDAVADDTAVAADDVTTSDEPATAVDDSEDTDTTPDAAPTPATPAPAPAAAAGPIDHVWIVSLSRQDAAVALAPDSPAPFLRELAARGTTLTGYTPVSGTEIANGLALLAGQLPTDATARGCVAYAEDGCVLPAAIQTLPGQLTTAGKTWRAYVGQGTGNACRRPPLGQLDPWAQPRPGDAYLTVRNPFVYFHSLVDDAEACAANDVALDRLGDDLATAAKTPTVSWIVPDACADGRDAPCADGAPAGLAAADDFLRYVVTGIRASPAWASGDGLIAVLFDSPAPASAGLDPLPPVPAVLVSEHVRAGATVAAHATPLGVLRTLEDLFSLPHLAHAADASSASLDGALFTTKTPTTTTRSDTEVLP